LSADAVVSVRGKTENYTENNYFDKLQVTIYLSLVGSGRELQYKQRCSLNGNGYLALLILNCEVQATMRREAHTFPTIDSMTFHSRLKILPPGQTIRLSFTLAKEFDPNISLAERYVKVELQMNSALYLSFTNNSCVFPTQ
jgi:hypothetical protein